MNPGSEYDIDINIEELVLDGFPEGDRDVIAEAFKRELSRLVSRDMLYENLKQNINIERLDSGGFQMDSNASGEEIGKQAAQHLYGGMQK